MKKLLQNSVYDHVINQLIPLLNSRCPSHLLLGYLLPLSDEFMIRVRKYLQLQIVEIPARKPVTQRTAYSEPLAPEIAQHLNIWMETLK